MTPKLFTTPRDGAGPRCASVVSASRQVGRERRVATGRDPIAKEEDRRVHVPMHLQRQSVAEVHRVQPGAQEIQVDTVHASFLIKRDLCSQEVLSVCVQLGSPSLKHSVDPCQLLCDRVGLEFAEAYSGVDDVVSVIERNMVHILFSRQCPSIRDLQ